MSDIIINDLRIQILEDNLIRIEQKYKNSFEDNNTFFIPNRKISKIQYSLTNEYNFTIICFNEYKLYIPNNKKYSKIHLKNKNGKTIYRFKQIDNSGELPKVFDTPDVFALNDVPHIIIPSKGYSIQSYSEKDMYKVKENKIDTYLFIINKDYKLLRKMYVELTGRVDLVRMQTLGLWNSRYYKYKEEEVYNLIEEYNKYNLPIDNFVIDTDWRKANDIGIGYEIDDILFPNIKKVFDFAHKRNISIMFNDHPEPYQKKYNIFDYNEIKYRESNLSNLLKLGLDMWWYDRNWHTKLISPTKRIEPETFGLYLFNDITKKYYQKRDGKYYTRPDIMGNVNNIMHGNYIKINDSASHRYSIQWTGDVSCDESSISKEVRNLIRASENEITYINFDVGGHIGNPDKELYLKWMKFAALCPIMRPHCTKNVERFREPWNYDKETLDICREYIHMKYRLLGYVYSNAYKNYKTGEPLVKSLSYEYPNNKRVKNNIDTYILGNNIMVSPEGEKISQLVEKKYYIKPVHAIYFNGIEFKGEPIAIKKYSTLNMILNNISPATNVPIYNYSVIFKTRLKFDSNVILNIRNDDGVRVYVNGELKLDDWKSHSIIENEICILKANEEYDIMIEYYQGEGEAAIQLSYILMSENIKNILIPGDKWIDLFTGEICVANRKYIFQPDLNKIFLFVKEGSLIPLLKVKKNTTEIKYDDLIIEYYPSKDVNDSGYIYEDDRKTIAYQNGIYRTTNYETYYDLNDNSCNIILYPTKGDYHDGIKERNILFKYYLINDCNKINLVTLNGQKVDYKVFNKNPKLYPFNEKEESAFAKTLVFKKRISINNKYIVKFYLK